MSIHPSLRGVDTLSGDRSVFKRIERIQQLIKDGKLQEDDSPFGLPKVRTTFKVKKVRAVEESDEPTAATGEAAETAEAQSE